MRAVWQIGSPDDVEAGATLRERSPILRPMLESAPDRCFDRGRAMDDHHASSASIPGWSEVGHEPC